ncbi:MAG TPA: hypothetical protein VFG68_22570 [Fimbriiglobus sp.]|nr:hypothetical protein [Fimbriiglobus sp.]
MPALKCPNPSCPFLFDPTQVPAGAVLTCPRCAMRFTLGPSPAGQPPPPQDHPPIARLAGLPVEAEPDLPVRRRRGEGFPILMTIGGVMLLFGVIGAALYVAMLAKRTITQVETGPPPSREVVVADKNFAYTFPGPPWEQDQETRNALDVHAFGLRRTEPPGAWAALEVSDFGAQSPTEGELRDKMSDQLRRVFLNLPEELPLEPATWAGLDARRCRFRGERKGTGSVCSGEVYLLGHKGFGYWFYTWSAERDAAELATQFDDLRARFRVLDGQPGEGIRPAAPGTVFRGTAANYQLTGEASVWKKPEGLAPTDEDPKADLLLKGELPSRRKSDFPPRATLVVLVLKDEGDAADVGGKYVRKRHTLDPEVFGPTKFVELTGEPEGDALPAPEAAGTPPMRLRVTPGGENAARSAEKLVVYSAIRVGDVVVVAEGSCPWSERAVWERRLIRVVGSMRE